MIPGTRYVRKGTPECCCHNLAKGQMSRAAERQLRTEMDQHPNGVDRGWRLEPG